MSQEKEKEKEKPLSQILIERMDNQDKKFESLKTLLEANLKPPEIEKPEPEKHDKEEASQGHKTIEEMLACPTCGPKLRDEVLKKEKEIRDKKPFVCSTCGNGVDKDEPTCPTCGGKHAKERK